MCLEEIDSFPVKSKIKDYDVFFEDSGRFLQELFLKDNSVFIVDENVYNCHRDEALKGISVEKTIILPICEEKKNLDTVCEIYEKIMEFSPKKNLNLISIGGGIVQDITGFVASTLYRGINWIFVPTTLLAQVDSCIGAKTSLNFHKYKNLIGTFYPPSKIHIYPEFLKTLTKEDFYSGVGEMAKLHLMNGEKDTKIFIEALEGIDRLEHKILLERTHNCLKIKKSYIEEDEFDTGRRNMLNYGHCFGHAIESATDFAISHGQAVVLGMILANQEAKNLGILSGENEKFIRENVLEPVLKVNIPQIDARKASAAMGHDKKNTGSGLALVMLKDGYETVKITDLDKNRAQELIKSLNNNSETKKCQK